MASGAMTDEKAAPSASAPCPRRQLLTYVAFTAGRGATPTTVYARDGGDGDGEWQPVGTIASGTPDAADVSTEAAIAAAQLQRRLVAEHACRLYPPLREAKRDGTRGIELGVADGDGVGEAGSGGGGDVAGARAAIRAVPASAAGDASPAQMRRCGFAGSVPPPKPGKRSSGMYAEFESGGNPSYDRHSVAERLERQAKVATACGDEDRSGSDPAAAPLFILFAWPKCGFCTAARSALEARSVPYRLFIIDKYSPEHAELAMRHGHLSVPYVFDADGTLLGGWEADGEDGLPGLAGALAAMDEEGKGESQGEEAANLDAEAATARAEWQAAAAANNETLPQKYFAELDYASGGVPWDLRGRPQPPVRNACTDGSFGPPGTVILDCGCGAGDNANWLAARGFSILGFDLSQSAVATAQARAAEAEAREAAELAGGAVEFVQASATALGDAERVQACAAELGGFEVALDSAMLHCLADDAQQSFVAGVRPLLRTGGRLFVGCFSDANPDPWSNPRRISEAQLRGLFTEARGWRVKSLESAWYERPSERAASNRGAWTMAWWCVAEAV